MKHLILFILLGLAAPSSFAANWKLDSTNSNISFFSIKKSTIGENHSFSHLKATLSNNGDFKLSILLSSVKTGITIRDDRMKKILFSVTDFPNAEITAKIQEQQVNKLAVGLIKNLSVPMTLKLHGHSNSLSANVQIAKLSANKFLVSSIQPIIINAKDFLLDDGIHKLTKIAGLPSIGEAVPVSFTLLFNKAD